MLFPNDKKILARSIKQLAEAQQLLTECRDIPSLNMYDMSYQNRFKKAVYLTEKVELNVRDIALKSVFPYKDHSYIVNEAAEIADIKLSLCEHGIIKLEFPPLLNYRAKELPKVYDEQPFYDLVRSKCETFRRQNNVDWFEEKCVLIVINIVSEDTPDSRISDNDNRNYHCVANWVKGFFIKEDSYKYLSHYYDTYKKGAQNKTIAFLAPLNLELSTIQKVCKKELHSSCQ